MKARLSNARISPKKMNLVAGLIRRLGVNEAVIQLSFTPKKAAEILLTLLNSAIANAENNFKQKREELVIDEIKVTKGQTYKRFRPVSRGRAHPYKRVNTHVIITLKASPKTVKAAKKVIKKSTKTKAEEPKAN